MFKHKPPKSGNCSTAGARTAASKATESWKPLTEFTAGFKQVDQKDRFEDHWLRSRIGYPSAECDKLAARGVALFFLAEAKIRYRQFTRSGCTRLRYSCWSACHALSNHLIGRSGCSDERTQEGQP
jgi:hypothetical protein